MYQSSLAINKNLGKKKKETETHKPQLKKSQSTPKSSKIIHILKLADMKFNCLVVKRFTRWISTGYLKFSTLYPIIHSNSFHYIYSRNAFGINI